MTYREFTRYIKKRGCVLIEGKTNHDRYVNPKTGGMTTVSRHWSDDVGAVMYNKMLKQLGLK